MKSTKNQGYCCWGGPCHRGNLLSGQVSMSTQPQHKGFYKSWNFVGSTVQVHVQTLTWPWIQTTNTKVTTLHRQFQIPMPGWRVGPRRHLMGPAGVRSIIDEVSRWNTFSNFTTSSTYANRFKWIQSPDIFFTPFSTSSICANGFTQYAKVGYYREFSPDGSEIEWGLVGGPVWKNMVKITWKFFLKLYRHKLTHISKSYFVKCIDIYWSDWELPVGWGKAWRRKDLRWYDLPLSRLHPWHRGAVPGGTPQGWQGGRPGRNPPSLSLKPWSQTGVKYGNHGLPVPVLATVRGSRYKPPCDKHEPKKCCNCIFPTHLPCLVSGFLNMSSREVWILPSTARWVTTFHRRRVTTLVGPYYRRRVTLF